MVCVAQMHRCPSWSSGHGQEPGRKVRLGLSLTWLHCQLETIPSSVHIVLPTRSQCRIHLLLLNKLELNSRLHVARTTRQIRYPAILPCVHCISTTTVARQVNSRVLLGKPFRHTQMRPFWTPKNAEQNISSAAWLLCLGQGHTNEANSTNDDGVSYDAGCV